MECGKCKRNFEIIYRKECKICGYWNRHKGLKQKIISEGIWSEQELDLILEKLFYCNIEYINDLLPLLNNKSLMELGELLKNKMPVRGQTKQRVKLKCYICHKEMNKTLDFIFKDRIYCSIKCRDVYRSKNFRGENSPSYKKIITKCSNCGENIAVIPYDFNKENSFGEKNNFCCYNCYYEFRSKHYVKEKSSQYGIKKTKEERLKMSENTTKRICEGKMPQTLTKPHMEINNILNNLKIIYTNEFNLKYQSLDIWINDYNLGIEIMGDYWHGNPNNYSISDINKSKIQLKDKTQDKRKHTYVKKYYNFEILYLWENDINKNNKLCELLISKYINSNGILQDYNSFNYYIKDNILFLKEKIVKPYFLL